MQFLLGMKFIAFHTGIVALLTLFMHVQMIKLKKTSIIIKKYISTQQFGVNYFLVCEIQSLMCLLLYKNLLYLF